MFEKFPKFSIESKKKPKVLQEEKEVSPEEHQKAIEHIKEIEEIIKKEPLTKEDLKIATDLIKKIERIYSPEISFESKKAKEMLENLKNTPLWDGEKKQWNRLMNKEQKILDSKEKGILGSERYSDSQLLGVIVEAFDEKPEEFVKWFTKKE